MNTLRKIWMPIAACVAISACAGNGNDQGSAVFDEDDGPGLFSSFGLNKKEEKSEAPSIGVNSYLWRATLDTLSFMPLSSADPFGGVIITDWYINPEKRDERFKATAYILDTRLRADGLKVSIHKQMRQVTGWVDVNTAPETELQIENAILMRARQLKLSGVKAVQ